MKAGSRNCAIGLHKETFNGFLSFPMWMYKGEPRAIFREGGEERQLIDPVVETGA